MSTLNGIPILTWGLHYPKWSSWRADVTLSHGETPAGTVTIESGTLRLIGKVKRSGFDAADRPHAIVVGGLGWWSPIAKPLSFQSDSGVRVRTVLKMLSSAAGETLELPTDVTIGSYYECPAARAGEPIVYADALNDLARSGFCPRWRVDPDGVTRFGARTAQAVTARATVLAPNKGIGTTTYGIDDPGQFLPGNTIDGAMIERVANLREINKELKIEIDSTEAVPTQSELVRRMVAAELGDRVRSYVVKTVHADNRCDLIPTADSPHLPEMRNVEQWTLGGAVYRATVGDEAIVVFADQRKTKPRIIGFRLNSGTFDDAARVGDVVKCLLPPATLAGVTGVPPATVPFTAVVTWSTPYTLGSVQTGSSKIGIKT